MIYPSNDCLVITAVSQRSMFSTELGFTSIYEPRFPVALLRFNSFCKSSIGFISWLILLKDWSSGQFANSHIFPDAPSIIPSTTISRLHHTILTYPVIWLPSVPVSVGDFHVTLSELPINIPHRIITVNPCSPTRWNQVCDKLVFLIRAWYTARIPSRFPHSSLAL